MDQNMEDWFTAGELAHKYLNKAAGMVKPGVKLIDVAQEIEAGIRAEGGVPAWPVNLSINQIAAHYTPVPNDTLEFTNEDLIKIDVGVSFNGAVGDNATTVDLSGKYTDLVNASRDALNNATKILGVGVTLGEIGAVIEETITKAGFQPVRNLSGHGISRFQVHTPPTVPNYATGSQTQLTKGQIIAIEPFATTGVGKIKDDGNPHIYELIEKRPIRDMISRQVFKEIEKGNGLPFGTRWLCEKFPESKVNFALRRLVQAGVLMSHAPLVEISGGMVTQAENTFLIDDDVTILTQKH